MPKGPEYALQSQIAELAHLLGWETIAFRPLLTKRGYRVPGSGSMAKGWPDMTTVRVDRDDLRLTWAELKSDRGALRPDQKRVLSVLEHFAGTWRRVEGGPPDDLVIGVEIWRPRDWPQIEAALR